MSITKMMYLPDNISATILRGRFDEFRRLLALGDRKFYASEACLSGGFMNMLSMNNWVRKTGETMIYSIRIKRPIYEEGSGWWWPKVVGYEESEKEVEVFQWEFVDYPAAKKAVGLMEELHKVLRGE